MSQSSAMNSGDPTEESQERQDSVVKLEVTVKEEALECVVCGTKARECLDIFTTRTSSGSSLHHFLAKYTQVDLSFTDTCSKQSCKACYDLITVLERAELEYVKLKEAFEAIISKNPLFELSVVSSPIGLSEVKRELDVPEDSEDEPLARRKSNRSTKMVKKKKKLAGKPKRKKSSDKNRYTGSS